MSDSARDRNVSDMEDEPARDEPLKDVPSKQEPSAGMRADRMRDSHSPVAGDDPRMRQPIASDGWRQLSDVEQRFHELEAEFIKEPQAAVKKAESLIEEAVERITRQLHDEVARMHGHAEGSSDTEQLRMTMLRYRTLIESIGGRRAA